MSTGFELRIVEQNWLNGVEPTGDLCSHGTVDVTIAGTTVRRRELGIIAGALSLMRSLDPDHRLTDRRVLINPQLLSHACGFPVGACPNGGIDWRVVHADGDVQLSQLAATGPKESFDLTVVLPVADYQAAVSKFVDDALLFYGDRSAKRADLDFPDLVVAFWHEFDQRRRTLLDR